jgi:hypothetical protein
MPEDTQHDQAHSHPIPSPAPNAEAGATDEKDSAPKKPLTAEEQMAIYEESLKESDWGHQPC